jgi:hypothetical protein
VTVWTFAGGASSSSVARELAAFDLTVTGFSEFSIHLRGTSAAAVADRIRRIDPQLERFARN